MKEFIRSICRIKPVEKALVFLLGNFPNKLLRVLASSNNTYPPGSIRICKRHGINYSLDINDYQNWLLYFYSDNDSSFGVLKYTGEEKLIFDIGGNIGQTALMIAKHTGDKTVIYSFEPYPATHARFKKNLELNAGIAPKIKLQQTALGAAPGKQKMYEDCSTNSGANRMVPGEAIIQTGTTEVPVSTVDIFVAENNLPEIDFIKIDVEGFEMEVLKGSRATLINHKPSLFIEVDNTNLKNQGSSVVELCEYLVRLGYTIYEEGKTTALNFHEIRKPINIYCSSKNIL